MRRANKIFLVEDDEDDQQFFKDVITDIDNTILLGLAVNGADALNKLANMTILPDLIFMDINMPVMNGLECLKRLKNNAQFKNIPVIILTTSTNSSESRLSNELAASFFLSKPADTTILRKNIDDVLKVYLTPSFVA